MIFLVKKKKCLGASEHPFGMGTAVSLSLSFIHTHTQTYCPAAGDNHLQILCSSLLLELGQGQEFIFLDLHPNRLIQNCRFSLPFLGEVVQMLKAFSHHMAKPKVESQLCLGIEDFLIILVVFQKGGMESGLIAVILAAIPQKARSFSFLDQDVCVRGIFKDVVREQ